MLIMGCSMREDSNYFAHKEENIIFSNSIHTYTLKN